MPKFPSYRMKFRLSRDAKLVRDKEAHEAFRASQDFADKYHMSVIDGMLKSDGDKERHDAAVAAWDKAVAFKDKYHMSVLEGILS